MQKVNSMLESYGLNLVLSIYAKEIDKIEHHLLINVLPHNGKATFKNFAGNACSDLQFLSETIKQLANKMRQPPDKPKRQHYLKRNIKR